jgi:hypothetical protein
MGVLAETYCCEIKSDLHFTGFDHGIAKPESPLIALGKSAKASVARMTTRE